jgi:RNA polymerase sigma factor (sigma-70 family)
MAFDADRTDGELLAAVVVGDGAAFATFFRPRGSGSARPWVLGIARNKLLESRRHGRVEDRARRRLAFEPEVLDDDDLARVDELASAPDQPVLELVEQLPEAQRKAVRSRVLEDREYADIAQRLNCSELVARQRVSRGLSRLRHQMTERDQ